MSNSRKEMLDSAEEALLEVLVQHLGYFFKKHLPQETRSFKGMEEEEQKKLEEKPGDWMAFPRMGMEQVRQLKREIELLEQEHLLLEQLYYEKEKMP